MKKIFLLASGAMIALSASAGIPLSRSAEVSCSPEGLKGQYPAQDMPQKKIAKRITQGGSSIYGYIGYDNTYDKLDLANTAIGSLCEFGSTGYTVKWVDPMWKDEMSIMRTGFLVDGKITGTVPVYYTGYEDIQSVNNYTFDFKTGKFLGAQFPSQEKPFFLNAAYNANDGYVYGLASYLYTQNKKSFYGRAKIDDLNNIESLAPLTSENNFVSICWNADDGLIYGIAPSGAMMAVDNKGVCRQVAQFGRAISPYQTGLAYSPVEKLFYWNVYFVDNTSALYTIKLTDDPKGGVFEYLYDFEDGEEFHFFITTDSKVAENAPDIALVNKISFPDGATSGSVSFVLPTRYGDGSLISNDKMLDYSVSLDGEEYTGGQDKPGSIVKVNFIDLTPAMHVFSLTTTADGRTSPAALRELYIGPDAPLTPENVELTEYRVNWDAVTAGEHNGWIDLENLKYDVYVDGKLVGTTTDLDMDYELDPSTELHSYSASVIAYYGDVRSQPGISNDVVAGKALSLPVFFAPTKGDAAVAKYYDGNYDGNGWIYSEKHEAWACQHALESEGDDWLFLPPVEIKDADVFYTLSFESMVFNTQYPDEAIEVCVGKSASPKDMLQTVVERYRPGSDYSITEGLLKVDAPGEWVVGFHYVSPEMQNGVLLRDVSIADRGVRAGSPAKVDQVKATALPQGELSADVDFVFPTKDISGNALPADAVLTAVVAGDDESTVIGKPGENGKATVRTLQGYNRVTVTVELDAMKSLPAETNVYTGIDIPKKVLDFSGVVSEDMMSVSFTWKESDEGEHGGYVNVEDVEYDFYMWKETMFGPMWSKVASLGKNTTYTYTLEKGQQQDLYQFGICPKNNIGAASRVTMTPAVCGTPYSLPFTEDFALYENDFLYTPWVILNPSSEYTATWDVADAGEFDSSLDGFLLTAGGARGTKARMALPCFSTKGKKGVMKFTTLGGEDMAGADVLALTYGASEPVKVGTVPANAEEGLHTSSVILPEEFNGKDWIQLIIDCEFSAKGSLFALRKFEGGDLSGVKEVGAVSGFHVVSERGYVVITAPEGEKVSVVGADATVVAAYKADGTSRRQELSSGVYIVRCGDRCVKVLVK